MNKKQMQKLEKKLNSSYQETIENIEALQARLEDLEENVKEVHTGHHFFEGGGISYERELVCLQIEKMKKYLRAIENALRMINKNDGYGICEKCGRPIPFKRLLAVPITKKCIKCKKNGGNGNGNGI